MTIDQKSTLKKFCRILVLTILILFIGVVGTFLYWFDTTVHKSVGTETQEKHFFEIKSGESTLQISYDLKSAGLINSVWAFFSEARIKGGVIEPGVYKIRGGLTVEEVYSSIVSRESKTTKITIPEGYRTEQIAQSLADKGIVNYADFMNSAEGNEGKIFPDTYYFTKEDKAPDVVKAMLDVYQEKTKDLNLSEEDLILASIVEREAINDTERVMIAGVYKNRLEVKMKLEADPTVQYSRDNSETVNNSTASLLAYKYWKPISTSDYKTALSSYNTYIYAGLPPGPICNPGIASINAVQNYGHHNYLYFIQTDGKIYPAITYKEHQANIAQYLR